MWMNENETYGLVWRLLSEAQDARRRLDERLVALEVIKKELGFHAYYRGRMPLPPVKHFKEGRPSKEQVDFLSDILNFGI
jgi:hypothetical protein